MPDDIFPVPEQWSKRAYVNAGSYKRIYAESVEDPEAFWAAEAKELDWIKPFSQVKDCSYAPDDVHIKWFYDGTLNVSANCVDRHLAGHRRSHRHRLGRRQSGRIPHHHLCRTAPRSLPLRQRASGQRRQERRPRHHLSADDPRGRLRHAGVRAHRRRPFGDLCRLLARFHRRAHPRFRFAHRHHRRRRPARRQDQSRSRSTSISR